MSYMDEDDHEFGEGFSMLNQDELSALLRSVGQHAAGNQATLVARLTAFMSGEHRGGGGPGFGVDGRVVVCCGSNKWNQTAGNKAVRADADVTCMSSMVLQWLPGTSSWAPLPDLPEARVCEASLLLPAGRTMIIGGRNNENEAVVAQQRKRGSCVGVGVNVLSA
eukprot:COSAG06_NODE_1239_length_10127_cov_2.665237_10_plen_165_part_00